MIRVATTTFPTVGLTRWMNISPIETLFLHPAAVKAGSFSEKFNFGLGFTGWSPTVEQVLVATLVIFYNDQDLCSFCKRFPFRVNATSEFFHYSTIYHLRRILHTTLPTVIKVDSLLWFGTFKFHLKIIPWTTLSTFFLKKKSNLGFVRQRHRQKSWEWD